MINYSITPQLIFVCQVALTKSTKLQKRIKHFFSGRKIEIFNYAKKCNFSRVLSANKSIHLLNLQRMRECMVLWIYWLKMLSLGLKSKMFPASSWMMSKISLVICLALCVTNVQSLVCYDSDTYNPKEDIFYKVECVEQKTCYFGKQPVS